LSGRSRKRGQRARTAAPRTVPRSPPSARPPSSSGPTQSLDAGPDSETTLRRGYRRGEERNEAIRATLTPLAPGERPWPLRVAVGLALLIAVGNIAQVVFGSKVKFGSAHTSVLGVALFSVIMLVCAVGMWQLRYWALLGFEALLAIVILLFCFVLVTSVDVLRAVIAVAVISGGGYLFFKLVRVLSRLQMPQPRRSNLR
jgi:hypothetical protein